MRVVSERTEAEIRTHEVEAKVRVTLRRLAANIMRVSRGSGSSGELGAQMVACIEAMEAYRDVVGTWVPSWDLNQMLDADAADAEDRTFVPSAEDLARWEEDGSSDRILAVSDIRRACLQMTASMLLNQTPQKARGEHDFHEGLRRLKAARERSRAYDQARYAPAPQARKKPKPR
ncbi:hypothetical protein SAMN05216360_12929 [Methylobacterium phyllostachyos]|uniref:Uncharacterized protein n=1 Tax=Methylobacterium phyllostachyos TaxID=582672 RepID=A0A1H0KVQ3_9HYPH|nr:hypothetical protein [Methylobacterium phyllostachyos]SDO59866.1 hypothetical protein SAMN05216360_12929 [Methylobacterium phyllostachyos]